MKKKHYLTIDQSGQYNMPTGIYIRTEEIRIKMRLSHQAGWISSYKKPKPDVTKTNIPTEISRAMRGWTKWGGANHGYLTNDDEWYCQACNEKQSTGLPSYLIRIKDQDFGRICSTCLNIALLRKINNIFDLITFTRKVIPDF